MANAIIFTDRAPKTWSFDDHKFYSQFISYPAGAYKLASHLRANGFTCVVIPNAMALSFEAVKKIIDQNSRDLVWIGVSTTFFVMRGGHVDAYREEWRNTTDDIIDYEKVFTQIPSWDAGTRPIWGDQEINLIAEYVEDRYQASVLIGGTWVTYIDNGNYENLKSNVHIIKGYAETIVEEFTREHIKDQSYVPSVIANNNHYDNHDFKYSTIHWNEQDLIEPTAWLPLEVSRGCAFSCAYCDYQRKASTDTYKDPRTLREELIRNYEQWGVTNYMLVDDLYNDNKNKVRVLYDEVWSRLPFKPEWVGYLRLDMLWADPESADYIMNSGCRLGAFGIETLHDVAGKKVGKGLGRKRILETLERLKQVWNNEVLISGLFIAGLPHEPWDSILDTIKWTEETDLLFNYKWAPMWITPPDHKKFVLVQNHIAQDYNKYGIKWLDDNNWVNQQGVTWQQVDQLCGEVMSRVPGKLKISFPEYADLRQMGFSHWDIVNLRTSPDFDQRLQQGVARVKDQIQDRLAKILTLKDSD